MQFGRVLGREGEVGQHVVRALVHQGGEFGPARPELVGDMTPSLVRGLGISLQKSLADCSGDHGVLALGHVRQGVTHPMHAAPLPCRTECLLNNMGSEGRAPSEAGGVNIQ